MVIQDILDLGQYLSEAAATDPLSAALLFVGHVLLLFSIGFFSLLTIGGILGALRAD